MTVVPLFRPGCGELDSIPTIEREEGEKKAGEIAKAIESALLKIQCAVTIT